MSITVNYTNNKIIINKSGKSQPLTADMPIFNFTDQTLSSIPSEIMQRILRKLDCLKDAKEGEGINSSIKQNIMNEFFPTDNSYKKLDLNSIKEKVFKQNKDKIKEYSWLKSSTLNENLSFIQNVFFETGLSPKSYIKNFKNPKEKVFDMIGSFQNEVGDPFLRKTEDITIRYPEQENTSLEFNENFMNYFGFLNTTYKSKLTNINNNGGSYDYEINVGNNNIYGSEGINKEKSSGSSIERFNNTSLPPQDVIVGDKNYKLKLSVTGDEYFKGNDYKNAVINALYNKNYTNNLPEIKRYIIGKELGDVMQVLLMMVWQISEEKNKKNYCMVSLDSIVFLLCNMLEQPCFYTHNSNKGKASEDKCYCIQYFFPSIISEKERMKMRFEQKYNEIYANNLKIKNFLNRIFIDGIIYIGNTAINYKTEDRGFKRIIIENKFINPINEMITSISEGLENFNKSKMNNDSIIEENDLITMNNEYLLLSFFGLTQTKNVKKYYLNGSIKNYTATIPLEYEGKKISFKDLFVRLKSGSLKGGASNDSIPVITEGEDIQENKFFGSSSENVVSPETQENKEQNTENEVVPIQKFSPIENKSSSSIVEQDDNKENKMDIEEDDGVIRLEKLSDSQSKSESPVEIESEIPLQLEDEIKLKEPEKQLVDNNLAKENEIINEAEPQAEPEYINNRFTDSLFLTFINQVVGFIENPSNNLSLNENSSEEIIYDDESTFYYYYDMICYVSYIQKRVYYDTNLLDLMKQLKSYAFNDEISIQEIINKIYPIDLNESILDEDISVSDNNVNTSITLNKSPKAIKYMKQLFETLDAIDSEPLDTNVTIIIPRESIPEELSSEKMEIEDQPFIGSKRSREIESTDEKPLKKRGGKTIKRKKSVKKNRKTRGGGSTTKKKHSIKKKASRRKRKTLKKRL